MSLLKMGGKAPDGTAKAVSVDAGGNVNVTRQWGADVFTVLPATQIRDTNAISTIANAVDVSGYGFVSLRFCNSLGVPVTVMFYGDMNEASDMWMTRPDKSYLSVTIPATDFTILTPEDIPELNYLRYIKLRIAAKEAPTQGSLIVQVVAKR